jgi:uncharacterized protein (TIGR03000 family)
MWSSSSVWAQKGGKGGRGGGGGGDRGRASGSWNGGGWRDGGGWYGGRGGDWDDRWGGGWSGWGYGRNYWGWNRSYYDYGYYGPYGYDNYDYAQPYAYDNDGYGDQSMGSTSFYPPNDYDQGARARLLVRVPANAEIWLDDVKMRQRGPMREFVTPPLGQGTYHYTVKARWEENSRMVERTKEVAVHPGDRITVNLMDQRSDLRMGEQPEGVVAPPRGADDRLNPPDYERLNRPDNGRRLKDRDTPGDKPPAP